jgi:hypothetical protein
MEREKLGGMWMKGDSPVFLEPRNMMDMAATGNFCLFQPKVTFDKS